MTPEDCARAYIHTPEGQKWVTSAEFLRLWDHLLSFYRAGNTIIEEEAAAFTKLPLNVFRHLWQNQLDRHFMVLPVAGNA